MMLRTATLVCSAALAGGCAFTPPGPKGDPEPRLSFSGQIVPHQSVAHSAGNVEGHYALGKYYLGSDRAALALEAFQRALQAAPTHVEARNGRATALARLGDLESAEAELRSVIDAHPDMPHLLNNLGRVLTLRGQHAAAADVLARAARLAPNDVRIVANRDAAIAAVSRSAAAVAVAPADRPAAATPQPTDAAPARAGAATHSPGLVNIPADVPLAALSPTAGPAQATTARPAADGYRIAEPMLSGSNVQMLIREGAGIVDIAYRDPPSVAALSAAAARTAPSPAPAPVAARAPTQAQAQVRIGTTAIGAQTLPAAARTAVVTIAPERRPIAATETRAAIATGPTIEVINGNGVEGMARRVGRMLGEDGLRVVRFANEPGFGVRQTVIRFGDGHESVASEIGRRFPVPVLLEPIGATGRRAEVSIVLGRDVSATDIGSAAAPARAQPLASSTVADTVL